MNIRLFAPLARINMRSLEEISSFHSSIKFRISWSTLKLSSYLIIKELTSRNACSPYRRNNAPALLALPLALSFKDWDPPCFLRAVGYFVYQKGSLDKTMRYLTCIAMECFMSQNFYICNNFFLFPVLNYIIHAFWPRDPRHKTSKMPSCNHKHSPFSPFRYRSLHVM